MTIWQRLYRGETDFDFVKHRRRFFIISASVILISLLALGVRGLHGSVDFTGGTIVSGENVTRVDVGQYRSALGAIGEEGARVQLRDERDGSQTVIVQTPALDVVHRDELVSTVATIAGINPNDTSIQAVGPTFGSQITRRAIEALVIFLIVIALFISWRFEWKMAGAALTALFHDLIITAGIYALVGFEVTPATVIAILTILGYSLYDTVVVFDKITENVSEMGNKRTFTEIANISMNQVLMRSLNTSGTSLLPIGSLLFVGSYLLGAATLREFALALFIGIAAGTYSSIFVATPLLTEWKEHEPEWQRMQRRQSRKSGQVVAATPQVAAKTTRREPVRKVSQTGAKARPPKQRRKHR